MEAALVKSVNLSDQDQEMLCRLCQATGRSASALLSDALREYERMEMFRRVNEEYAQIQADPASWKEELAERRLFEGSSMDGLRDE